MIRPRALAIFVFASVTVVACVPDGPRPDRRSGSYALLLEAEDARPPADSALATPISGTDAEDPRLRRVAVRALGRLESPELALQIAPHLSDADPTVRAAAAEALAQSVHGADGTGVLEELIARAAEEEHPLVRGSLARSIGRLALDASGRLRASEALVALGAAEEGASPGETLVGVALGFDALVRGAPDEGLAREAAETLDALTTLGLDAPDDVEAARVRALALASLGRTRRLRVEHIERALEDPNPEVRRAVLSHLNAAVPSRREELLAVALADPSPRVAIDAVRILASGARDAEACDRLLEAAAAPASLALRLVALEGLSRPCPGGREQSTLLTTTASELPAEGDAVWQPAARALLSLVRIDRRAAADLIPRFSGHVSPFVRSHAAAAAGGLGDELTLGTLAADTSANVRTAATLALFAARGHEIDDLLIHQLESDDPQLLLTVAGLLEGSPRGAAAGTAALAAFERISGARRETWRDPRLALLERVAELGNASLAGRLEPYLRDYDAVVAAKVAELLTMWTGQPREADPIALARAPLPTAAELEALEGTSVALHMRGGGTVVIDLMPELAPRNAWRFVSLARAGYYDGLTFHRWAPNFVIQGGSPGANEYQGDGPYTRDEVGGSHWRGTVGVSTRGRDTGDGQIFINLVDNVPLDHDYTVFGVVREGMEVVDAVLEGAVIERADVLSPR